MGHHRNVNFSFSLPCKRQFLILTNWVVSKFELTLTSFLLASLTSVVLLCVAAARIPCSMPCRMTEAPRNLFSRARASVSSVVSPVSDTGIHHIMKESLVEEVNENV